MTAARATLALGLVATTLALRPAAGAVVAVAPLRCVPTPSGHFQALDPAIAVTHTVVNPNSSTQILVTDALSVRRSLDSGCSWTTIYTAPQGSIVVDASFLHQSAIQVLVSQGSGSAISPHVFYAVDDNAPTFAEGDGLPALGTPIRLAGSRRKLQGYVAVVPASPVSVPPVAAPPSGTILGQPLPTTPPVADGDPGSAILETDDGGRSFTPRVLGSDLPGTISRMAVDDQDGGLVWIVAGGHLLVSTDKAQSFKEVAGVPTGATALAPLGPGEVAVFAAGRGFRVTGRGASAVSLPAPAEVTSAALRATDSAHVLISGGGHLFAWTLADGATTDLTPAGFTPGGDVTAPVSGAAQAWIVGGGGKVYRYFDPLVANAPVPKGTVKVGGVRDTVNPTFDPGSLAVHLGSGQTRTVPLQLSIPPDPTPVDLLFLLDHSTSFNGELKQVQDDSAGLVETLLGEGVDLHVGLAVAGSRATDGTDDPPVDPRNLNGTYTQPVIYDRVFDMGDPQDFLNSSALAGVRTETVAVDRNGPDRHQAQLAALDQALDGTGIKDPNTAGATDLVPAGQQVHFRPGRVRRVIVDITDDVFKHANGDPAGTPASLDAVGASMRARGILHLSILSSSYGADVAHGNGPDPTLAQHQELARAAGTLVGPGGLDCGDGQVLKEGDPVVCTTTDHITQTVESALKAVTDLQPVEVQKAQSDAVLSRLAFTAVQVDAFKDHQLPVSVTLSCPVAKTATTHTEVLQAMFRGDPVAQSQLSVDCGAGPAPPAPVVVAPAAKVQAQAPRPPNPPAAAVQAPLPAPAPPVAPPVVVQAPAPAQAPQVNAQTAPQAQVTNQVSLASEEQQQAALALAAAGLDLPDEEQFAFVDRRSTADHDALITLALGALVGTAALTLSRRKTQQLPPLARNQQEHQ